MKATQCIKDRLADGNTKSGLGCCCSRFWPLLASVLPPETILIFHFRDKLLKKMFRQPRKKKYVFDFVHAFDSSSSEASAVSCIKGGGYQKLSYLVSVSDCDDLIG